MNSQNKVKLFLVDDDAMYLKLLEIEFLQYPEFHTGNICNRRNLRKEFIAQSRYYYSGLSS